jgi:hypothetical protein
MCIERRDDEDVEIKTLLTIMTREYFVCHGQSGGLTQFFFNFTMKDDFL